MAATYVLGVRTRSMKLALLPAMTKFRGTKPSAKKTILPVTPSPRLEEKTPSLFGTPEEPRCDRCKHVPEEALAIHKTTGELACHAPVCGRKSATWSRATGETILSVRPLPQAACCPGEVRGVKNGASLKQSGLFAPIDVGILLCGKCYHSSALEHHVLFASSGMQMTKVLKVEFAEEFRQYFVMDKEADEMAVRVRSQEDPYVTEKWVPKECGGCNKKVHLNFENLYAVPRDPIGGVILYCFDCSKTMPAERAVAMHFQGYTRPDNWFKIEGRQTRSFSNAFKDAKIPPEFAAGITDTRRKKARKAAIAVALDSPPVRSVGMFDALMSDSEPSSPLHEDGTWPPPYHYPHRLARVSACPKKNCSECDVIIPNGVAEPEWPPRKCGQCHRGLDPNMHNLFAVPDDLRDRVRLVCDLCASLRPREQRSCAVNFPGFARGDSWFKVQAAARTGSFFDYLPEDLPLYRE
eukprot:jgi/Mesvir1/5451/Mv15508-RA.1